jgi:ATP-dependent RNA helicase SUPV3L1/SUV3
VTGIARGVAYRLIEDLGVLERHKVAEDVKGLDQNSRAILRKYGVRFGAYHIYVPPLLKPAPRALATLLYAIKHDSGEMRGLDEVQQLASSGRTSIPANKDIQKNLYRVAGYRVAGERAVRVDILERLADLIRPALAWRDNAPGIKPPGALDGTGFTVTVGMTSLVGSSGEDFASILRSLGYRMERRPKPSEPVSQPETATTEKPTLSPEPGTAVSSEAAVSEIEAPETANDETLMPAPGPSAEQVEGAAPGATVETQPVVSEALQRADETPANQALASQAPASEAPSSEVPASDTSGEAAVEAAGDDAVASATSGSGDTAASGEPEMIEVWRPGRFEGREKRPHRKPHRREHRAGHRPSADQPAVAAEGAPAGEQAAAGVAVPQERRQDHRPQGPRPPRKDRGGRPRRHEGGQDAPRFGKPDNRPRQDSRPRPERREREPDPNSPFAKLAALKAQLEADSKERR